MRFVNLNKRYIGVFIVLICTSLLFVSCASGVGAGSGNNDIVHTIDTDKSGGNVEKAEESVSTPQYGGSVSIFSYKPDTLCPILTNNNANIHMLNIVYDGLVDIERDMSVIPALATLWNVSDDARTWNITLREGVIWHDGSEFSAEDVKYTIEQIKANKDSYYSNNVKNIKSMKADGLNIEIILKEENSEFIKLLSFPIIKKQVGNVKKEEFVVNGTGAFKYEDRNEGNMYHLVRNDLWWNGSPYLDEVIVKLLPDRDTALYSFSSGAIDLTPSENSNWGSFIDSTTDSYLTIPTNKFTFLGLNNTNNALKHEEVRRAIGLIVNREEIVRDVLLSHGSTVSAPISRKSYMFDEENGYVNRDTEQASQLLEENGWQYRDGFYELRERTRVYKLAFEILVNEENAVREQIANAISRQLNEFGFSTTVKKVSFDEYNNLISKKKYDMFVGTYGLAEDNDFRFMLERGNAFGFSDKDMDGAMRNIRVSVTESGKKQAYSNFQKIFNAKAPIIGLCFEEDIMLYKTTLKGQLSSIYNDIYRELDKIYIAK